MESDLIEPSATAAADAMPEALLLPERRVAALVRQVHRGFRRALDQRLAAFEVTAPMWSYLLTLWQQDGISQRELSRRINLEGPSVGAALRVMERRGLIRRDRNLQDRREWRIVLTPRGRALERELLDIGGRLNDEALSDLSPAEVHQLVSVLGRVRATLDKMAVRSAAKP